MNTFINAIDLFKAMLHIFKFKILTSSVLKVKHFIYLDKSVPQYYQIWLHL